MEGRPKPARRGECRPKLLAIVEQHTGEWGRDGARPSSIDSLRVSHFENLSWLTANR
jgi:hypothetical protein